MAASALDHHITTCPECSVWFEEATRLTRMSRLGMVEVPDLADLITENVVLPARRVLRRRLMLRLSLCLVGLVQLWIALVGLAGDSIGMAMSEHATHEAAAWNLALAAAFIAAASSPRRAAGLTPLLATFIVTLGILSVHDYAAGAVSVGRLATHLAAVVGLLLVLAVDRAERALPPGRLAAAAGDEKSGRDGLRGVA
jgi:predicted anti-sigma-YlaC factor YlaD